MLALFPEAEEQPPFSRRGVISHKSPSLVFISYFQDQPELSDGGLLLSHLVPGQVHSLVYSCILSDSEEYVGIFQSSLMTILFSKPSFNILARLLFAPN